MAPSTPAPSALDLSTLDIETERLRLRAYREEDAEEIHGATTPDICRYMTFNPSASAQELRSVGRKWLAMAIEGREVAAVIRNKASGRFLGMGGLHYRNDPLPGLGIWIRADAHGRGYGREAIVGLIAFARETLDERAVLYSVAKDNAPSRRIPESLGGTVCGDDTIQRPNGPAYPGVIYRIPLQ